MISTRSMSSIDMPARASTFRVAGIGAVSIIRGSSPASEKLTNRARGVRPSWLARSSLMISSAAAPSVICDELPAVTRPPSSSGAERRLQLGERLDRGVAQAFVGRHRAALGVEDREDLAGEAALVGGPPGERLAAHAELVHVLAADAPLVGDQLGGDPLRHEPALGGVAGARPPGRTGTRTCRRPSTRPSARGSSPRHRRRRRRRTRRR